MALKSQQLEAEKNLEIFRLYKISAIFCHSFENASIRKKGQWEFAVFLKCAIFKSLVGLAFLPRSRLLLETVCHINFHGDNTSGTLCHINSARDRLSCYAKIQITFWDSLPHKLHNSILDRLSFLLRLRIFLGQCDWLSFYVYVFGTVCHMHSILDRHCFYVYFFGTV